MFLDNPTATSGFAMSIQQHSGYLVSDYPKALFAASLLLALSLYLLP